MSAGRQAPSFVYQTDNLTGTPSASVPGTNFTAGANNADGTVVAVLGTAVANDIHLIQIGIGGISISTGDSNALLDLLYDPAGGTAWQVLIADLVCGFTPIPVAAGSAISLWYTFPLYVKSGATFAVQARTAHTADITTGRVILSVSGLGRRQENWWCGTGVESIGINASSSKGTTITPGNASYSAFASVGSTTANRIRFLQFAVNGSDATAANFGYFFQCGRGGVKLPFPTIYRSMTTTEVGQNTMVYPCWVDIPIGTQLQARAISNGAGEDFNVALYGVY